MTDVKAESSAPEQRETEHGRNEGEVNEEVLVPAYSSGSSSAVVGPVSSDGPEIEEEGLTLSH